MLRYGNRVETVYEYVEGLVSVAPFNIPAQIYDVRNIILERLRTSSFGTKEDGLRILRSSKDRIRLDENIYLRRFVRFKEVTVLLFKQG